MAPSVEEVEVRELGISLALLKNPFLKVLLLGLSCYKFGLQCINSWGLELHAVQLSYCVLIDLLTCLFQVHFIQFVQYNCMALFQALVSVLL